MCVSPRLDSSNRVSQVSRRKNVDGRDNARAVCGVSLKCEVTGSVSGLEDARNRYAPTLLQSEDR